MKYFIFIFFCLIDFVSFGKTVDTTALKNTISKNKKDTITVNAYYEYSWEKRYSNLPLALKTIEKGIKLSKEIEWEKGLQKCYYAKGNFLYKSSEFEKSIVFLKKALDLAKELDFQLGIADCYNGLGLTYDDMAKHSIAIDYFFKAIKSYSSQNYNIGMMRSYGNLGNVYFDLNEFDQSINYHKKSLSIAKKIRDDIGILNAMVNIGLTKQELGMIDTAIIYFKEALKISERIKDPDHINDVICNNLGAAYMRIENYDLALEYLNKAYEINLNENNQNQIAMNAGNIALVYYYQGDYDKGEKYLLITRDISRKINLKDIESQAESLLAELNEKKGDFKKALEHFRNFQILEDSINNVSEQKQIAVRETEFKNQQKATADSLMRLKEDAEKKIRHEQEVEQQRIYTYFGIGIAIVALGFVFFIYRGLQQKKKANTLLEEKNTLIYNQKMDVELQKIIIEEKHKEITDSINYAERLQRSLMASKSLLDENLKDYFIYFNPKEAVSGDFYWASKLSNGDFLLACADSTGHGVPGAIMSMMNMTSLKEAVKDGFILPNEILNETRKTIIETLANDGTIEGGKDGMDGSLLSFDFKNNKLKFSLANNPLWIIRNNEIMEFSPDKMPVGRHDKQDISFSIQEIELKKGDMIYAFTDGYADQFGGEKGKKFKYTNLKNLLLVNVNRDLNFQSGILNLEFEKWRGNMEQVDDVCIIGIKI